MSRQARTRQVTERTKKKEEENQKNNNVPDVIHHSRRRSHIKHMRACMGGYTH